MEGEREGEGEGASGSGSSSNADAWKQYATEDEIKKVAEIESNPNATESELFYAQIMKDSSLPPNPNAKPAYRNDIKATNLFYLSSVSILRPNTLQKLDGVELYGRIHLVDDNHDEFSVFCLERMRARFLSLVDNSLDVSLRDDHLNRPHLLPKFFWVKLYLRDRFLNVTLFKGKFKLDFTGNILFDKEQCLSFDTPHYGAISIRYTILKFGVMAMVECKVDLNPNPGSVLQPLRPSVGAPNRFVPWVKGTISAVVDPKLAQVEGVSRVLFDQDCSVPHSDEQPWTSPWFAVHAYSSLQIIADLELDGEKFQDSINFEACHHQIPDQQVIRGHKWQVVVRVHWKHAFDNIPINDFPGIERGGLCGESSLYFSGIEDYSQPEDVTITDVSCKMQEDRNLSIYPRELVEVFSIIVYHFADDNDKYDDHVVKKKRSDKADSYILLKGVIESRDSIGSYEIFKRDDAFPALVESHGALSILHPSKCPSKCYRGPNFGMRLDLVDGHGHEISKGLINMNDYRAESWYGVRVCSLIPGDFGFSAVHYTFFDSATQAKINVRFKCLGSLVSSYVYGRIYARYGSYRYFTNYEKENYQSMLFEKLKVEDRILLNDCADVPLSKDFVAVPEDDSLIIVADLRVTVPDVVGELILRGKSTFPYGHDVEQVIYGNSCAIACLEVCVQWGIKLTKI